MSSGVGVTKYINEICIHEAGHVAVVWDVYREVPSDIQHFAQVPLPHGQCTWAPQTQSVLTFPEARSIAAYYEAGRSAILRGQKKGQVDPTKDPDFGYSKPQHSSTDAGQIQKLIAKLQLQRWSSDKIQDALDLGRADADRIVLRRWGKVRAIGEALEASSAGIVYASALRTML